MTVVYAATASEWQVKYFTRERPPRNKLTGGLQRNMADDEVLFDDVYELCEIIGK